jgi:iron complex outermembrane receptor protein
VNTGKIENYGAELEAEWRLDKHWTLTTNHSFLHMNHAVVAAPEYKGFLGAAYRQGRWMLNAGLQYIDGLYTAVGEQSADDVKESFCLLDAAVSYQLVRGLSLWLRGENLLAQSYEINLGYPMPRATFMSGVNIAF